MNTYRSCLLSWNGLIEELRASSYRDVLSFLSEEEVKNGIALDRLWALLDEVYDEVVNVPPGHKDFSDRLAQYYNHPIWLINGIWHDSSEIAVKDRMDPVELMCKNTPDMILDLGGGIGLVARLLANKLPSAQIHLVDISELGKFTREHLKEQKNIFLLEKPKNPYPAVISTEVLEHVPDLIGEIVRINALLKKNGIFVATWCFNGVIKCHIEKNFCMQKLCGVLISLLGFKLVERRGRAYKFIKTKTATPLDIALAGLFLRLGRFAYWILDLFSRSITGKHLHN